MINKITIHDSAGICGLYEYERNHITRGVIMNLGFGLVGDLRLYNGIIGDPRYMKVYEVVIFTNFILHQIIHEYVDKT